MRHSRICYKILTLLSWRMPWICCSTIKCILQNPNFRSGKRFFASWTRANLLGNNFSHSFDITGKIEIGRYEVGKSTGFSGFYTVIIFAVFHIFETWLRRSTPLHIYVSITVPFLSSSLNMFTVTSSAPRAFFGFNWSSSLATSREEKNLIGTPLAKDSRGWCP